MSYKFNIGDLVEHKYASKGGTPLRGYVIARGVVEEPIGVVGMYYYRVNWFNMMARQNNTQGVIFEQGIKFGELVLQHLLDGCGD